MSYLPGPFIPSPSQADSVHRAATVNPDIGPNIGDANKLYFMFYLWGYTSAFVVYSTLSYFFPAQETIIPATIYDDVDIISGASVEKIDCEGVEKAAVKIDESGV